MSAIEWHWNTFPVSPIKSSFMGFFCLVSYSKIDWRQLPQGAAGVSTT
jgi:hypothetical protein